MSNNKNNLLPSVNSVDTGQLDETIAELTQKIVQETSVPDTQDLVELFNWNLSKKNAIRMLKLSGLYDKITDQMLERFERRSGEFSNADLLSYLQTVESSIDKAQKNLANVSTPAITVQNNTQVNVNVVETLDQDSRERIADALKALLGGEDNSDAVFELPDADVQINNSGEENK